MKYFKTILTILAATVSLSASAVQEPKQEAPKIGLALSGGGAKGAAHIGVLKVLEEEGIPIDYVCGTSMGAIIGGLYSLGYTPSEIEHITKTVDWGFLLSDDMSWRDMNSSQKDFRSSLLLAVPFGNRIGLDEGKQSLLNTLPGGFIGGANILNTFNSLAVGYQDEMDFADLPIPYCCVASDVAGCKQAVLKHGRLADAMRGSMAIPGAFAPVKMDDMLLVDGGVYNNFPVDVCKEMGPDFIIGVNVRNEKDSTVAGNSSLPKLLGRLVDIMTDYGIEEHAELCDLYFLPDMTGYSTFSFDSTSINAIIARGYAAADAQRAAIKDLRAELDKYGVPYTQSYKAPKAKDITPDSPMKIAVSDIETPGLSDREKKWMLRISNLDKADSLDGAQISAAVSRWKGTGFFESVNYYVSESDIKPGTYVLKIKTIPEQKNLLGLGFRYDTQEAASLLLHFGYNQNSIRGFKVGVTAKLSYNPKIDVVLSYSSLPLPAINLAGGYRSAETGMSLYGDKSYSLAYNRYDARLYLSQYNSKFLDLSTGLRYEYFDYSSRMSRYPGAERKSAENTLSFFAHLKLDNRNSANYPNRGIKLTLDGEWLFHALDSPGNTGSAMALFESYVPIGNRVTLIPQAYFRALIGNPDFFLDSRRNLAGGQIAGRYIDQQLPMIGIRGVEYKSANLGILRADLRWNIVGKHYATAMVNGAHECVDMSNPLDRESSNTWLGLGLEYAYDTLVGPLKLSFEWSDIVRHSEYVNYLDRIGVYLSFGYDF